MIKKLSIQITITCFIFISTYVGGQKAVAQTIETISLYRLASVQASGYDGVNPESKEDSLEDYSFDEFYTFLGVSLIELSDITATPTCEVYSTSIGGEYFYLWGDLDANADVTNCLSMSEECSAGSTSKVRLEKQFRTDIDGCVNFQANIDPGQGLDVWITLEDSSGNRLFHIWFDGESCEQPILTAGEIYTLVVNIEAGASADFKFPTGASGSEFWVYLSADCSTPCP